MRRSPPLCLRPAFFGVLIFGRSRVASWVYLFSTAMVALGTTFSAFWIMVNNSWMQVPMGYVAENGGFVPDDWTKIIFNPVVWVRFPHMLIAAYLTGAFCVSATGAWYVLRSEYRAESRIMLRMGLGLAALLVPIQLFFGHLVGDYVHDYQPAKFAAIEARWHDEKPAGEVLIAMPDADTETNRYAITIPLLGSIIGSMSLTAKEIGLTDFPPQDRPPVLIPFFTFRIMVGCGLLMLGLAWLGSYLSLKQRLEHNRLLLWLIFLSFPLPFVAILTGWYTAEVGPAALGRLWGVANRRCDDALPDRSRRDNLAVRVLRSLQLHLRVRSFLYISPAADWARWPSGSASRRCNSQPPDVRGRRTCAHSRAYNSRRSQCRRIRPRRRIVMVMFWVAVLAISMLLYVLLDGFDLGVGILFGLTRDERARRSMMSAVAPVWDGNETWLVVNGVVLWGAFPLVYSVLFSAFYLPLLLMLAGLILRGVAFEYRSKTERMRWIWDAAFFGGSLVAAFMQGLMVGALVEGLPVADGRYAGGELGWLSPFALLCGVGLCIGYALLGVCWLVRKCEGDVRERPIV